MEEYPNMPDDFVPGDVVKLSNPSSGEESARYVVTEWNGDRGFVRLIDEGMKLPPVELVRAGDVVPARKDE
jgi:hypothetical protein